MSVLDFVEAHQGWTSGLTSLLRLSLFYYSWKISLLVDGSPILRGIMVFVPYVTRKNVSLDVVWGEQ